MTGKPEVTPPGWQIALYKRASIQDFISSLADFPLPIWPTSPIPFLDNFRIADQD